VPPALCAAMVGPPANADDALSPPVLATRFSGYEGAAGCGAWDHAGSRDAAACPQLLCLLLGWCGKRRDFPFLQPKMVAWPKSGEQALLCSAGGASPTSLL